MKRKSWIIALATCLFVAILALLGACGESKPKKYSVTAESGEGYTVSGLEADGYAEGAQVTFTVTVTDDTKEIESVASADVNVEDKGEGTYGFTMPAKAVTVNVTLKAKEVTPPTPVKYLVTVASGEGYTVSGLEADGYAEGAQVTFTVTVTDDTKEIDSVTSADVTIQDKGNGAYGFTMPAKAVTVTVTLKNKTVTPESYTVTFDANAPEGATVKGTVNALTAETDGTVTIPDPAAYTADGWLCVGWATSPTGKADLTQGDLRVGQNYTPTGSITLYACWLKGYEDATGASEEIIYVGTSVLGQGSAIRVDEDGKIAKMGFADFDQETGALTGFTFYYEEAEGGNVVGLITEDGYVLRGTEEGYYYYYNHLTGYVEANILYLDGYGKAIYATGVGEQVKSEYGYYEYDPDYDEYYFAFIDPATGESTAGDNDFFFILEETKIEGVDDEKVKGVFYKYDYMDGLFDLYEDGYLYDYPYLFLDGYGTAYVFDYDEDTQQEGLVDMGEYHALNGNVQSGEYVFESSLYEEGFRFTLGYIEGDTEEEDVYIYLLFNEARSGVLNEKNGTGTLELDGYGGAKYTSSTGEEFEGMTVFNEEGTICTLHVYGDTGVETTLDFVVDLTTKTFAVSVNEGDFVIAGGVLIEYTGDSKIITIPDGVTEIADEVFSGMDLISVVIPASVTKIGAKAFQNSNTLTRVTFLGTDPDAIEIDWAAANDPFRWPAGGFVIVVPEANVEAFRTAWSEAWTAAGRSATLYTIKGSEEVNKRPEFEVDENGVLIAYNRPNESTWHYYATSIEY